MNAYLHSKLSVKKRQGRIEDYYNLHDYADCSKEVCSTNAHRVYFHTLFGIKNFIIPIFGHTIINSDNIHCNVKDIMEHDHCLPDFNNRFIPTLQDFIDCVADIPNLDAMLEKFYRDNEKYFSSNPEIKDLMLLPLWNTGEKTSLLLTHNSWFLGFVLPKIFPNKVKLPIVNFEINPSLLFQNMEYKPWMNGVGVPPSFEKIYNKKREKQNIHLTLPQPSDMVFDGSRKDIPFIAPDAPKFDDAGPFDPEITTPIPKEIADKLKD